MTRTSVGWWTAAAAAGVVALLTTSGRAEAPSSWRVTRSEVRVICPLTLGGAFEARTDALRGTLSLEAAHPAALVGRGSHRLDVRPLFYLLADRYLA